MKKFIITLVAIILTISTFTLSAQPQQRQQRPQQQQDGNFTEFQLQVLTKQLQIEDSKQAQFTKLYTEYSEKIEALQPKPQHHREGNETKPTTRPTDSEVEAIILDSFVMAEKSTELKREYYYKFKEILTPQQIFKMYNIERRMRERILSESDRRTEGDKK